MVTLLKDKNGNYLTLTKNKDEAFRFENHLLAFRVSHALKMDCEKIEEEKPSEENCEVINKW